MNWLKFVRAIRGAIWLLAAFVSLYTVADFEQRMVKYDVSAMQQSARATVGILELLSLLIVALAFDRLLELRERAIREKRAAISVLPSAPV